MNRLIMAQTKQSTSLEGATRITVVSLVILGIIIICDKNPVWLSAEAGPGYVIYNTLKKYYEAEKANKNTHDNSNKTLAKEQEQLIILANLREDRAVDV